MENNGNYPNEKDLNVIKVGSFELDMIYAKSWPGLIRIFQIIALAIAFFCALTGSSTEQWESNSGIYVFWCIILVVAMVVSFYTFFTLLAKTRSPQCFGYSWIFLELLYFAVFGGLVFLGSCLSANKADGVPALSASAAFGFLSLGTFGGCFWIVWKAKKDEEDKAKKEAEMENDGEPSIGNNFPSNPSLYPDLQDKNDFSFHRDGRMFSQTGSRRHSTRQQTRLHSVGSNYYDGRYGQRRRFSASDKDSAFSEGMFNSYQDQLGPSMIRRSVSAESMNFPRSNRQKLPSCFNDDPLFHDQSQMQGNRRKRSLGFPQRLSTTSFSHMPDNHEKAEWDLDYADDNESQAKSIPGWLRAALQDDELDTYDRNQLHSNKRRNSLHSRNEMSPNFSVLDGANHSSSLRNSIKRKNYGTMPCLDKEQSFNSFPFNEDHRPSHQSFNGRRRSRKEIRDNMQNGYPLHFY